MITALAFTLGTALVPALYMGAWRWLEMIAEEEHGS